MEELIKSLEKTLTKITKQRVILEKKYCKIPIPCSNTDQQTLQYEIQSKLFWLGSMSGSIKQDIEKYKDFLEKINLIKIK